MRPYGKHAMMKTYSFIERKCAVKKTSVLCAALFGVLFLPACAGVPESAASASQPPASISQSGSAVAFELNSAFFDLLEGDNAFLKQTRQGSCHAEITGRGTARVLYFEPFLDVQMILPEEGSLAAWREGYGEGSYLENPFVDDLPVLELTVEDEIDPLAPAVFEQDSLRQLFVTDALITYPMLCEGLGQTPELTHTEDVYYNAPIPENWPLGNDLEHLITGGDWHADFSVDELRLTVSFIQTDGEYVAYRATLSEE